jgi:hypothetical protein
MATSLLSVAGRGVTYNSWRKVENVQSISTTATSAGFLLVLSIPDPCHFGVEPDPDPRIHASD